MPPLQMLIENKSFQSICIATPKNTFDSGNFLCHRLVFLLQPVLWGNVFGQFSGFLTKPPSSPPAFPCSATEESSPEICNEGPTTEKLFHEPLQEIWYPKQLVEIRISDFFSFSSLWDKLIKSHNLDT